VTAVILRGDAASLPLPDASVDLIVTSPPYFGLRSYTDGGAHYAGQIGSEATPREFTEALLDCTREWVRVLKPSGSIFVNLGDKYSGSGEDGNSGLLTPKFKGNTDAAPPSRGKRWGAAPKSLLGLPWRYALGCVDQTLPHVREQFLDELLSDVLDGITAHERAREMLAEFDASPKSRGLGLILRAEIVWAKPNGLPESVTDRVRRAHEQVFHFTKQPRYFAAVDEVREAHGPQKPYTRPTPNKGDVRAGGDENRAAHLTHDGWIARQYNPLGKLPGSVWEIPSQPLTVPAHLGVDHFAAFPMELPRRVILGWSPAGICLRCGEGRRPVRSSVKVTSRPGYRIGRSGDPVMDHRGNQDIEGRAGDYDIRIAGYACACPDASAPTRPAVVLDPFGGTGTTALVAAVHGRTGISVDRSADYCRLAVWRTSDPAERAKAMCVPKPPPVIDGQVSLFDGLD
jgi:DNA modification methylase